jgi:hypothetical protein
MLYERHRQGCGTVNVTKGSRTELEAENFAAPTAPLAGRV